MQPTINKDGRNYVETLLLHESGEYIGSETEIVCKEAHNPQAMGAAISYSRRYSLQSLLSIGAEDNDAEGAMNRVTPIAQKVVETKQNGSFNNNKKTVTPVAAKPAPAALDESGWD